MTVLIKFAKTCMWDLLVTSSTRCFVGVMKHNCLTDIMNLLLLCVVRHVTAICVGRAAGRADVDRAGTRFIILFHVFCMYWYTLRCTMVPKWRHLVGLQNK